MIGIAWTAGAVGIADAIRSWRRYTESAEAELQAAVLAAEAEASRQVSEERLVIARELHDLLAHNLSVMNVQTGAALHLLRTDPDQAEASLTTARDAGRTVLDELRELLSVLRHDHDDGGADVVAAVGRRRRPPGRHDARARGSTSTGTAAGAPRPLPAVASLAAYRIVQEGLTNAAKHGDGSVVLAMAWADDGLTIRIENPTTGVVDETRCRPRPGRASASGRRPTAGACRPMSAPTGSWSRPGCPSTRRRGRDDPGGVGRRPGVDPRRVQGDRRLGARPRSGRRERRRRQCARGDPRRAGPTWC